MKAILLILSLCLLLAGCGGLENAVIGSYKAKVEVKGDPNDPGNKLANGIGNAFADMIKLELKADKTFVFSTFGDMTGNWAVDGDTLTLTPSTGTVGPAVKFKISDGGKTLTALDQSPGSSTTMTLQKQ